MRHFSAAFAVSLAFGGAWAQQPQPQPEEKPQAAASEPSQAVVVVKVVKRFFTVAEPHVQPLIVETASSGIAVREGFILTSLEAVRSSILVEVRAPGAVRGERARVAFMAPDCGVAVLQIESKEAARGLPSVDVETKVPSPGTDVLIMGYDQKTGLAQARKNVITEVGAGPIAGSDVDRPVILRLQSSSVPGAVLESMTGGAVVQDGRVIGMYFRDKNREYGLHSAALKHVIEDVKDGRYDGFPSPGFLYSPAVPTTLRKYLEIEGQAGGIRVDRVNLRSPSAGVIFPGDIILEVGGKSVDSDGRVEDTAGKKEFLEYLRGLQAGPVQVRLLRAGREMTVGLTIGIDPSQAWRRKANYDDRKYFLAAGLVLQEFDYDVFHESDAKNKSFLKYRYRLHDQDNLSDSVDRYVILTAILNDPINAGAGDFLYGAVASLNGQRVRSLDDFIAHWKAASGRYIRLDFWDSNVPLVIDSEVIKSAASRIEAKYKPQENGRVQ